MERRVTQSPFSDIGLVRESRVARYAKDIGWIIGPRNLLVEGTTDLDLLELAAACHARETKEQLLGDDLKVVAAGYGEMGGVGAVERRFMTIHELSQLDRELRKKDRIKLLPLFDDDEAGRATFRSLTQQRHPFKSYVHVFLLKRRYPSVRPNSPSFIDGVKEINREWEGMDCEMEDLLSQGLLDAFCDEYPGSLKQDPIIKGNGHHHEWTSDGKARLHRFARDHAMLEDVADLVRLLKYVRWIFDLPHGHPG